MYRYMILNSFLVKVPILYSLKTPQNLWFSSVFRGYKMGTVARNVLRKVIYLPTRTFRSGSSVGVSEVLDMLRSLWQFKLNDDVIFQS